jgi:hypothetical protein
MSLKILAGAVMMVPALSAYVYLDHISRDKPSETLKRTGVQFLKLVAIGSVVCISTLGAAHVISGIHDIFPKICPRAE